MGAVLPRFNLQLQLAHLGKHESDLGTKRHMLRSTFIWYQFRQGKRLFFQQRKGSKQLLRWQGNYTWAPESRWLQGSNFCLPPARHTGGLMRFPDRLWLQDLVSLGRRGGVDSFYIQGHQKTSQRKQEEWEEAALGKRVVYFGIIWFIWISATSSPWSIWDAWEGISGGLLNLTFGMHILLRR